MDFEAEQPLAREEAFRYVVHTTDWASQGERSARAVHRAISVDRKGFVAWRGETDWTGYDTFMFDFYNPLCTSRNSNLCADISQLELVRV